MLRILFFISFFIKSILFGNEITYEKDFVKELVFNEKAKIGEIYISDPHVLNVQVMSKNKVLIAAEGIGRSVIRVKDRNGTVLLSAYVNVQHKISPLKKMINELYPNVNIDIRPYGNQVFLLGKVNSPLIAKDLESISKNYFKNNGQENEKDQALIINKLEIELPIQVMLKIKVVELSRDVSKGFGIEWNTIGNGTANSHGLSFGSIINGAIIKDIHQGAEGIFTKFAEGLITNWKYTKNGIAIDLSALLNVLENESLVTVLAEPTVVALSGEQAKFKSGGSQAFKTTIMTNGTTETGSQFTKYGVDITFTPTVITENLISIKLEECNVIVPGQSGNGEASERSISTTVQMADGQTIAIAGLQKKDYLTSQSKNGIFANLPIIGDLFAPNQNLTSNETELVITITPYIIKPSKEKLYYPVNEDTTKNKNSIINKYDKNIGVIRDYNNNYVKPLEEK